MAGTTIAALSLRARFSCMVVGIDRQGFVINNPSGAERLFPLDVVLVAGTRASIRSARAELEAEGSEGCGGVSDFVVERIVVPEGCPRAGIPLGDSRPGLITGAQVAGIRRGSSDLLSPDGKEYLKEGDELLVIGDRSQLERFRVWLSGAY